MSVDYEAKCRARRGAERQEIISLLQTILGHEGAPLDAWAVTVNPHDMAVIPSDVLIRALRRADAIINGEG